MSTVEHLNTYTLEQYSVESWSEDGKAYLVTLGPLGAEDDLSTCSCPAFTFRPAARPCKHITEAVWQQKFNWEKQVAEGGAVKEPVDVVDIMAKAFQNGLETGFEMGRKMERRGLVR